MSDDNAHATSRVQVSVRVRPVTKADRSSDNIVTKTTSAKTVLLTPDGKPTRSFNFDTVFAPESSQDDVYNAIGRPMLEEAYKGFNVCLFAYGQTGSGKTYSLLGSIGDREKEGVAPRFVRDLFAEAQQRVEDDTDLTIRVSMSMIEVYMEKVRDLLAPRQRGQEPESLEIHEDANRRVYVKDAGVHPVLSFERMVELLKKGNANRQTAETKMNETSSRSHAIVSIFISQEYQTVSKKDLECTVSLVDLAGSERQAKTESTGQHFEEAKKINHSLLMLGRALNSFSDRKHGDAYISLRESKLTRLLSESFGGNSKTWMLATVAPTAFNLTETTSALEYASNAMAITNRAIVNNAFRSLELKELKTLVAKLEKRLEKLATEKDQKTVEVADLAAERSALSHAVQSGHSQENAKARLVGALAAIRAGNAGLARRLAAAQRAVLPVLDNSLSTAFFKGQCELSLRSLIVGEQVEVRMPLCASNKAATGAELIVRLFPLGTDEERLEDGPTRVKRVVSDGLQFCLHIVGAEGVPSSACCHVFCRYSFCCDATERFFTTTCAQGSTSPRWDACRQFEIPFFAEDAVQWFQQRPFFSFEVFGFPA